MSNVTIRFESAKSNVTITENHQHAFDVAGAWLEDVQPAFCSCTLAACGETVEVDLNDCEDVYGHYDADATVDALARAYKAICQG